MVEPLPPDVAARLDEVDAMFPSIKRYGRQGEEIKFSEYCARMGDLEYKTVGRDEVGSRVISTVWLGDDMSFGEGPVRLIFETMVFGPEGEVEDARRYPSEEAALAGHREAVTLARTLEDLDA